MPIPLPSDRRARLTLHAALSYYVTNGLAAAFGLLLISGTLHLWLGALAGSAASVGVIVCIPPDQAAPKRGKFWQLLPAALIGLPLFYAVQVLHTAPLRLGLLLVPMTFLAFLGAAWGKRGLPISISVMFAMVFSMAAAQHAEPGAALMSSAYFALGAFAYVIYATLANALLNARYRAQLLADTLLALAALMRTQALQFTPAGAAERNGRAPLIGQLLKQQAALADQLQTARDILLESPRTPRRQQLAGMLMLVLEMRDHLLACELDLDLLKSHPGHAPVLDALREVLGAQADDIERLAEALLMSREPPRFESRRPRLQLVQVDEGAVADDEGSDTPAPPPAVLARGLATRVGHIDNEALRLSALARGEAEPDLAVVRAAWQMFVSPTVWSWRPFAALWRWDAPPLRHAIRAALAIGSAYAIALALPWGTHDYWILLTIVVVLRGSLAQTLERRNSRVAGTLLGCALAACLLALHAPPLVMLLALTIAQAVAHGFALKRYLITAVAATVLGLVQAHLLDATASTTFEVVERIADTLIGVGIAWAFSYVLPSWERTQIPSLVARTLAAQGRHARIALGLGQLQAIDNEPEVAWRLARREAYDSLSALVQATQRSLSEPRAVRPPLAPLGRMLAHSYQLLAQLTAIKTNLMLGRSRLDPAQIRIPLQETGERIATLLMSDTTATRTADGPRTPTATPELPDPFAGGDLSPWVLRRLDLAAAVAEELRDDAGHVLRLAPSKAN